MSTNRHKASEDDGSPQEPGIDPEAYNIQLAISLLMIICLGALASFAFAPYFLPQTILQAPTVAQAASAPPLVWSKLGLNSQDLTRAQTCAKTFTIAYETFNIKQPSSLTAATPMLSRDAKARFVSGNRNEPEDPHVDAKWLAQAHKDQLQQSAQVLQPAALQTVVKTDQSSTVSASFIVTYKLTTTSSGKISSSQQNLLVYLAEATGQPGGWQVIDWKAH